MTENNYPAWLKEPFDHCKNSIYAGVQTERIPVEDACGRVVAETVKMQSCLPRWPYTEESGHALLRHHFEKASPRHPVEVEFQRFQRLSSGWLSRFSLAGDREAPQLEERHTIYVPAGIPMPPGADTVLSSISGKGGGFCLEAPPPSGRHVFKMGEDYGGGEILAAKGERITPQQHAVLLAAGIREIVVNKRPRVGVAVSSYDQVPFNGSQQAWQRPDSSGPYIRSLLRQWGYDVSAVEYIDPVDITRPDSRDGEIAFEQRLQELGMRYDLIIGAGMPNDLFFRKHGLNRAMDGEGMVEWKQTSGNRFYFGYGRDRSPVQTKVFPIIHEDGTVRGEQHVWYHDRSALVGLPGFTSEVAMLMHVIVRRILDEMEYVADPGPYWETGTLAQDVACDAERNRMLWGTLGYGVHGEVVLHPFDSWHRDQLNGFALAEVLIAIPAGAELLRGGSAVHFLRLDRTMQRPTSKPHPIPVAAPPPWPPETVETDEPEPPPSVKLTVPQCWTRLDEWLQTDPARLPGGLNPPATEAEIAALQAGLGVTLPEDFVASLRIHNGQPHEMSNFFEGESLLSVKSILARWTIWRQLVEEGAFEDIDGGPDAGIREDWYHLQWIPFTSNGCGDYLCLDLAPAEGGVVGQVIRVWHDDEERTLEAGSFTEWLNRIVADKTAAM